MQPRLTGGAAGEEVSLADEVERLTLALESSNVGIYDWDLTTGRVHYSDGWKRLLGYAPGEIGSSIEEYESRLHPDDADQMRAILEHYVSSPWPGFTAEFRLRHRDGSHRWVLSKASFRHEVGRGTVRILGTLVDITEQKQAEELVRIAHRETERVLEAIPSILIGLDPCLRINRWSRAASLAFGMSGEVALGRFFVEVAASRFAPGDLACLLRAHEQRRPVESQEMRFEGADGHPRSLLVSLTPVAEDPAHEQAMFASLFDPRAPDHAGERLALRSAPAPGGGSLVLAIDHTEHRSLEAQLAQAQRLESIGQMAAGVAHEINTPVQYIGDNLRFLVGGFGDLAQALRGYERLADLVDARRPRANSGAAGAAGDELDLAGSEARQISRQVDLEYLIGEVPRALEQTLEGVEHVARIVRAMKELSHPGDATKVAVDLNHCLETVVTVTRNEWRYVAEVAMDLHPALPPVHGIPGQLTQALLNLLVNAAHAIEERRRAEPGRDPVAGGGDGARPAGRIALRTRPDGSNVVIEVEDDGCGIPDAIRDRIFDPFFTTKEVGKGTGQGLAIAYAVIVKNHRGAIAVNSSPGRGTVFQLTVPVDGLEGVDHT